MTLLDQTIRALMAYRKRNGYARTINPLDILREDIAALKDELYELKETYD